VPSIVISGMISSKKSCLYLSKGLGAIGGEAGTGAGHPGNGGGAG
jgi:hypothetical protein